MILKKKIVIGVDDQKKEIDVITNKKNLKKSSPQKDIHNLSRCLLSIGMVLTLYGAGEVSIVNKKFQIDGVVDALELSLPDSNNQSALYMFLNDNKNLNDEEREILYNTIANFVLDYDNLASYIDFKNLIYKMSEFSVNYKNEGPERISGQADMLNNEMYLYIDKSDSDYSSVFAHEAFHLTHDQISCHLIEEGVTELLTSEYLGVDCDSYPNFVYVVKELCELLDPETVLKCYFSGDMTVLKNALMEIDNNEKKAQEVIDLITVYGNIYMKYLSYPEKLDINLIGVQMKQLLNGIDTYIADYYKLKYGKNVSDDAIMSRLSSLDEVAVSSDIIFNIKKYYFAKGHIDSVNFTDLTYTELDDYLNRSDAKNKSI